MIFFLDSGLFLIFLGLLLVGSGGGWFGLGLFF